MPRNVEVKARSREPQALRRKAAELAGTGPVPMEQEGTFFPCPRGRLKLRRFADGTGELIHYLRPDRTESRESTYTVFPVRDGETLRRLLAAALGGEGVVRKHRTLLRAGKTRVHFDDVEGLGSFIELKVVLAEGESCAQGEKTARRLEMLLGILPEDRIAVSHIDLLAKKPDRDRPPESDGSGSP